MYFIVKTHSVLCLLLSNDKFYIHFGGSLEYWINEYEYEYECKCEGARDSPRSTKGITLLDKVSRDSFWIVLKLSEIQKAGP